ncbi:MAG: protein kinase, partial [Pirellulales bacterium]|nr:protein kinase [Pirellulales bacterium]
MTTSSHHSANRWIESQGRCTSQHRLTQELAGALLADELEEDKREAVEDHLESCDICQRALETVVSDERWNRWAGLLREQTSPTTDSSDGRMMTRLLRTHRMDTREGWPRVPGYVIEGELGRGGMGVVYRARHLQLNRSVALKMLLAGALAGPERLSRFLAEAETLARLKHPNIVQIHDIGDFNGIAYLSLELVEGGSLAEELQRQRWSPAESGRLVEQIARAVAAAHQQGVVHRDLKPANILLTGALPDEDSIGQRRDVAAVSPKVSDFGLARQHDSECGTRSDQLLGTPSYMAPEQFRESAAGDPATDIYALGCLLYEMLTGSPPVRSGSLAEAMNQVLCVEPTRPRLLNPSVPVDLENICLKCLEKEPRRRYATALAFADDLARWRRHEPVEARQIGVVGRTMRWARRNPSVAALTVVLAIVFVVAAAIVGSQWRLERTLRQGAVHLAAKERRA